MERQLQASSKLGGNVAARVLLAAALLLFFAVVVWFRFRPWQPSLFYGDDLFNYMLYHGDRFRSYWGDLFFADSGQKFRFVFSGVVRAEIVLFGKNTSAYFLANVLLHATSAAILCVMSYMVCRSWLASLVLGVLAATSHLGLYEVTQATGQVESLGLLFCLLSVFCMYRSDTPQRRSEYAWCAKWKWLSLLFAFLAFNSHERYIVLLCWLSIFFVLHPRAGSLKPRAAFLSVCAVLVISNALIKNVLYHSNFFQGTGGQPLSFHVRSAVELLQEAVLSVLGINHGPQYLTGAEWADFSVATRVASVMFAAACLGMATLGLAGSRGRGSSKQVNWPFWFVVLGGLLLLPACLTIRMEQRWELGPFFLLLLMMAFGVRRLAGTVRGRAVIAGTLAVLCVCATIIEARISQSFHVISYISVDGFAKTAKRVVVDGHLSPPGEAIIFVANPGYCIGTLLDGGFFLVYEGKYRSVECVDIKADALSRGFARHGKVLVLTAPDSLVNVAGEVGSQPGLK